MPTSPDPAPTATYLRRLLVALRGELRVVSVETVTYIEADRSYALVHTHGAATPYPLRLSLSDLERRLNPRDFCRIHRSTIVRLDAVEALLTAPGGDYTVRLAGGVELSLARSRRDTLIARLEG
ncbi:MAG: LytTR family DNA-binding domain-containing protein [Bacteroidota bacterium]